MSFSRSIFLAAQAVLAYCLVLSGCARTIGSSCTTNVDCSALGNRICDIGSPAGYCTVDGCDYQTCPDNANCVRFFTVQRNVGCYSSVASGMSSPCRPGEVCVCDTTNAKDGSCAQAYCASEKTERRWCMRACDQNSDCRDNYACYQTGGNGAVAAPYRDQDGITFAVLAPGAVAPPGANLATQLSYCAPNPPPVSPPVVSP